MNIWGLLGKSHNHSSPAWDPSAVAAKTIGWWRADSLVTGTTWTDKTNGVNTTATTVTQDSSGINGQDRIVFPNSANNQLASDAITPPTTAGHLFAIGKWAGGTASLWNIGSGAVGYINFGGSVYENGLSTTRQGPFAHGLSAGDAFVYEVRADSSGNVDYRINGASIGTFTGNVVGGTSLLTFGGNGSTYMNGEIEEILYLNDVLTSGEHTSMAAYVLARYGLTL